MSIGLRIKEIRITKAMSQGELADFLGIPQSNLFRYENNTGQLNAEKLNKFYQLGINTNWLLTGEGSMLLSEECNLPTIETDTTKMRLIDMKASAGGGILNYEEVSDWISVPLSLIYPYNPSNVDLIFVDGDSMEPLMSTGDLLVVDPFHIEFVSEKIFVIRIGEELRVKRLQLKANGNIGIYSENNQRYPTEEISLEEFHNNVSIVARVVKVIHAKNL